MAIPESGRERRGSGASAHLFPVIPARLPMPESAHHPLLLLRNECQIGGMPTTMENSSITWTFSPRGANFLSGAANWTWSRCASSTSALCPTASKLMSCCQKGSAKLQWDGFIDFLERAVSVEDLHFNADRYFLYLDEVEGGTIEWYFECKSKFEDSDCQDDYHRLVLKNYLPSEGLPYWDWKLYSSLYTTYEMDKDYVKFVDEMSSNLQWLKMYFGYDETSDVWDDMCSRGLLQALKIAKNYTHMTARLANVAFEEYIRRSQFYYLYREDKDALFFEIRKRVANGQLTFEAALRELLDNNLKTKHVKWILCALESDGWRGWEEEYNACVKGIPGDASEDCAKDLIRAAVSKFHELNKPLHEYMEKKMQIAKSIGLVICLDTYKFGQS